MKQFAMIAFLVLAAICAGQAAHLRSFQVPVHHDAVHHGHVPVTVKPIAIISQESEVNPDGSFHNVWESENGIKVQEEGSVRLFAKDQSVQTVRGHVSYTDLEGKSFVLNYVADENGFRAEGEHLPTPPPLPLAIARSLEYIKAHPYVEKEENVHFDSSPVVEAN